MDDGLMPNSSFYWVYQNFKLIALFSLGFWDFIATDYIAFLSLESSLFLRFTQQVNVGREPLPVIYPPPGHQCLQFPQVARLVDRRDLEGLVLLGRRSIQGSAAARGPDAFQQEEQRGSRDADHHHPEQAYRLEEAEADLSLRDALDAELEVVLLQGAQDPVLEPLQQLEVDQVVVGRPLGKDHRYGEGDLVGPGSDDVALVLRILVHFFLSEEEGVPAGGYEVLDGLSRSGQH